MPFSDVSARDLRFRTSRFTAGKAIDTFAPSGPAPITADMTLEPGDIIATGTPPGVGFTQTPPRFLREGDVVEVEIEGLGAASNPVTSAPM